MTKLTDNKIFKRNQMFLDFLKNLISDQSARLRPSYLETIFHTLHQMGPTEGEGVNALIE